MEMLQSDGGAHRRRRSTSSGVELDRPVYDLDVEATPQLRRERRRHAQSIYGFRGADIRNLLDFQDDFPDARTVKLEQNYRSTQTILSAANGLIRHNREQLHKELWTDLGEGDPVVIRELDDEHAEARYVVGEIERLVDEGVSRAEIAVFYRMNAQSRVLEDNLVRREIGYQVIGGTKFYERAEIKDAIAYLTVLGNGQDVVSFTRVVNSPKRGIGQTSLSRVIAHADTMGIPVWDAAADAASVPGLGAAAIRALDRFMETMATLRARAQDGVPVGDLLEALLHEIGYLDALEAERTIEAQGRTENLQELVEVAREYDATAEEPSLEAFLQQIALVADADTRRDDEGLVTLMTLHNAKGLEYPIVFIIGCRGGRLPALAQHRRGLAGGGAPARLRRHHPRDARADADPRAPARSVRRGHVRDALALPRRDPARPRRPPGLGDHLGRRGVASGSARPSPLSWDSGGGTAVATQFRVGEDVVHAAFGEGVVTAVEPGGVIVVHFAGDGSDRKLMAEYAPIEKR